MPTYAKYIRKMFEYKRLLMLTNKGRSLNHGPENQPGTEFLEADTVLNKGVNQHICLFISFTPARLIAALNRFDQMKEGGSLRHDMNLGFAALDEG